MNYPFDFERLDAYQVSLKFANQIFLMTSKFERLIQHSLGDQFRRAALSICNNIAGCFSFHHQSLFGLTRKTFNVKRGFEISG